MDSHRFDQWTRSVGQRLSRRQFAAAAAGIGAASMARSVGSVAAQDATPVDPLSAGGDHPAFLFVQLAETGTWTPKPDEPGVYLLTLAGMGDQTLYFSDRPERIVGAVPTERFLEALGFTPANPPNAAIVVQDSDGQRDVLVVELMDPVYSQDFADLGDNSVVYEARVLENYQGQGLEYWDQQQVDDTLSEGFSDVSLFIDDCPDLTTCYANHADWTGGCCRHEALGPIPHGPYGRCWSWDAFWCVPCDGDGVYQVMKDQCWMAYPTQCAAAKYGCFGGG